VAGAGVSGLVAARGLAAAGAEVVLVEARPRLGGRVLTTRDGVDLGPAWLWPSANPRVSALVSELGLKAFPQFERGSGIYETPQGRSRIPTWSQGSMRLMGGMTRLVDALADRLAVVPSGSVSIRLETRLDRLDLTDTGVDAVLTSSGDAREHFDRVVLALPPRLLADTVHFEPGLPPQVASRWEATPTWMAGHAKFVATYASPFWRELGLSGMASSQVGPMVEIHDASPNGAPPDGTATTDATSPGALFGFIGIPAPGRRGVGREDLVAGCVAQLERVFGAPAAYPLQTSLMDWAEEPWTARAADRVGFGAHPQLQPSALPAPWADRVLLAGSEFSSTIPGYLEGAVQAAEAAVARLSARPIG